MPVRIGQRREEADQHRSRRELRDLVGGRPADADDRLGSGEQLAARDDSAPAAAYSASEKPAWRARALLDRDREAGAHEPPDRVGDERDPALAGFGLFRDGDPHGDATLRKREGNRHPLWKPSTVGSLLATFSTLSRLGIRLFAATQPE